jgi:hypothetical protein
MPVTMIDTIGADAFNIPASAPKVAGYVTGSAGIIWTDQDWARFSGGEVHINQDPDSSPLNGNVLDVEPVAWTNEGAAQACKTRLAHGRGIHCYTASSNLTPLVNELLAVGITSCNIWLANWSLSEAEATHMVYTRSGPWPLVAVQWASPTSNPDTILPGSSLTLAQANCDLSVTADDWF